MYQVGTEVHAIFKTLRKVDDSDTYTEASKKITDHLITKRSQFSEDQIFRRSTKRQDESVDEFIMRLRQLATHCKYADVDKEILAHFVAHCNMEAFQMKAVREDTLDLKGALTLARGYERDAGSLLQLKSKENSNSAVNYVQNQNNKFSQNPQKCRYCGNNSHQGQQQCPAYNKSCLRCGKKNHFATVCRSQGSQSNHQVNHTLRQNNQQNRHNNYQQQWPQSRQQHQHRNPNDNYHGTYQGTYNTRGSQQQREVRTNNFNTQSNIQTQTQTSNYRQDQISDEEIQRFDHTAYQMSIINTELIEPEPRLDIKIGDTEVRMIIVTGAVVNMINVDTYNKLNNKPNLHPCSLSFYAYGETKPIIGQLTAEVIY